MASLYSPRALFFALIAALMLALPSCGGGCWPCGGKSKCAPKRQVRKKVVYHNEVHDDMNDDDYDHSPRQ